MRLLTANPFANLIGSFQQYFTAVGGKQMCVLASKEHMV